MNIVYPIQRRIALALASLVLASLGAAVHADPSPSPAGDLKVNSLFTDNMVLQTGASDPIWGAATPGAVVTAALGNQKVSTTANAQGNWSVKLGKMPAGGSYTLNISDSAGAITVKNVTFGEVWLASGQSNMVYALGWDPQYNAAEIASATDPDLRFITLPERGSLTKQTDFQASWQTANPQSVMSLSGVGYFFGRNLRKALGVPVGIIVSAVGATPVEAWTSIEAISADPAYQAEAEKTIQAMAEYPADAASFPVKLAAWQAQNGAVDSGNTGFASGWASPSFDDSSWTTVDVPRWLVGWGMKAGGVVWLRKSFVLPDSATTSDFNLNLNWSDKADITVYVNGQQLGDPDPSHHFYNRQLGYHVSKALIHSGSNLIAIRIVGLTQNSYFWQTTQNMGIPVADPTTVDGKWKFNVEKAFPPLTTDAVAAMPVAPTASMRTTETAMFNGMIYPLIPYRIRGAIWYQGESNSNDQWQQYGTRLPMMVTDWRSRWGEGDFPFYIEQIANWGGPSVGPGPSDAAGIRFEELQIARKLPNSGLAVAIDIGEESIHPRNKREAGRRLSLVALAKTYGQKIPYSGPLYSGYKVEGSSIRISFEHTDGGLVAQGGPLKTFQIAGADQKWVWANATIDGPTVVVSAPSVTSPVAVRYAWAGNPVGCNLYNGAGLPASPFRTDEWPH